ncbi:MAG TPA: YceI family protein [Acidimicrobiia bacterium]|nr:YceI family protein [Acidimicrobiia bacterium]
MKRRLAKVVIVLVVLLAALAGAFWWFVLRDDAPPEAALPDRTVATTSDDAEPQSPDGTWTVQTGDDVFVGYRIEEQFAGDTITSTAVGRTAVVSGSLVVTGTEVTAVDIEADTTALESDASRRDGFIRDRGLETTAFPTASFRLTEPIDLGGPPELGAVVAATATGELELHGVAREVQIAVEARWNGDTIDVSGSLPIVLADYDIERISIPFVTVAEDGVLELQLTFARA